MIRFTLIASGVSGFMSVALGAFAAHSLKQHLDAYLLGVFHTGVEYQMSHSLALLATGLLLALERAGVMALSGPLLRYASGAFVSGILIFSGSLYCLALSGVKLWGAVTPFGGVAFLVGWVCLTLSFRGYAFKTAP